MAEQLSTVLGFEAAQAIRTLKDLDASLLSYTSAMRKAANATRVFNIQGGQVKRTLANINAAAQVTNKTTAKTSDEHKKVAQVVRKTTKSVESGAKKQEKAAKKVLLSWQSVIRIFAIQVMHQAITRVTSALSEGVAAARDYEISLAEIQTIGRGFRDDFEGLSDQVREFSDLVGAPIETVAEGVYQALSNQVTDAAHSMEFMAAAQKFATASVTETSASVALLSSVINSYNMEVEDAAIVGGKLAEIIELGRLRGEEFANSFGRITVLAAQLGIALDEVGAAVATLTVSGLKYNEASTLMLNIMLKLIRPTEELKKQYKELGIAGAEAGIQAYGFQGFLDKLSEKAGSSATALGKMWGRVRAIRGVLGLANESAEQYAENLEKISKAGAKELFEKRDIIFETNAKQVEIELNRVKNYVLIDWGRDINKAIKSVFDTFGGGVETLKVLGASVAAVGVAFIALKAEAIGAVLTLSGITFPGVIIAGAVTLAGMALYNYFNKGKIEAINAQKVFEEQSNLALKTRLKNIQLAADAQKKSDDEMLANIQKYLFSRQKAFEMASKDLVRLEDLIFTGIVDQLGSKISETNTFFSNLEKKAIAASTVINDLNKTIRQVQFDISDFNFERETRGLDPVQKAFANIRRASEFRFKATEATRKRETELATLYNKRAQAAANIALQSADESENKKAIVKAEQEIRATYLSEIATLKKKKVVIADEKKQIESVAEQIFLQRQELKFLNSEIENSIKKFEDVRFDPVKREEVLADIAGLVGEMEAIFSDVKISFKLPEAVDMRNLITGERETMEKVISDSLSAISERAVEITTPKTAIDIKLAELLPGTKTIEEQQAALVKLGKIKEDALKASKAEAKAIREVSDGINKNTDLLIALKDAYLDITKVSGLDILHVKMDRLFGTNTMSAMTYDIERAGDAAGEAMDYMAEATKLLTAEELDIDAFNVIKKSLVDLAAETNSIEIKQGVEALIDNLNAVAEAKQEMTRGTDAILSREELAALNSKIVEINELIGAKLAAAATEGATSIADNMANARREIDSTIKRVKALNTESRMTITPMDEVDKRFGGMLYRADGGWIPQGTDTVPAMLTPGEFVMNAGATRQFYSQLVAMNAGVKPQYRQNGGSVTNVGDVNITVNESISAQQTARETMQAFRREMRRGTSRL